MRNACIRTAPQAFLCNYGVAMYITYPRAGRLEETSSLTDLQLDQILPQFASAIGSFQAMIELATVGQVLQLHLAEERDFFVSEASTATTATFVVFILFYFLYIIMSLILLLNLLIAMMGNRFGTIIKDAALKHRVNYARRML